MNLHSNVFPFCCVYKELTKHNIYNTKMQQGNTNFNYVIHTVNMYTRYTGLHSDLKQSCTHAYMLLNDNLLQYS